jgi:hypothetical protein
MLVVSFILPHVSGSGEEGAEGAYLVVVHNEDLSIVIINIVIAAIILWWSCIIRAIWVRLRNRIPASSATLTSVWLRCMIVAPPAAVRIRVTSIDPPLGIFFNGVERTFLVLSMRTLRRITTAVIISCAVNARCCT